LIAVHFSNFIIHVDENGDHGLESINPEQLADLVCHPIGRHLLKPKQTNRADEVVERKIQRNGAGRIEGYGLKTFPYKAEGVRSAPRPNADRELPIHLSLR
jgi:hypothetical protein